MKVKLIKDRSAGTSGYTLGNEYLIFDESEAGYFIIDDDGLLRFVSKSLKSLSLDWEIVE